MGDFSKEARELVREVICDDYANKSCLDEQGTCTCVAFDLAAQRALSLTAARARRDALREAGITWSITSAQSLFGDNLRDLADAAQAEVERIEKKE